MIYHIVEKSIWNELKYEREYTCSSLKKEGFIHCSFKEQILKVAETVLKGRGPLVILCINEKKLQPEVKVEDLYLMNEKYPHVYGALNRKAVEYVADFPLGEDGHFHLPNLTPPPPLTVLEGEWT